MTVPPNKATLRRTSALTRCLGFCFQEKSLPGVVMALVCNVFEMLYQLANLDESR